MSRDISIIIPTYNRPDDMMRSLGYYFQQIDVLEIIIVDDCSTRSYQKVLEKYKQLYPNIPLKYVRNQTNRGAGGSRNVGLAQAIGKYILWGEDDAFPSSDYTKILKSKINGEKVIFGSIYYGISPEMNTAQRNVIIKNQQNIDKPIFNYKTMEGYYRKKVNKDVLVPWGHALLMAPREVYDHIKYFEGYKVNGYREETDAQVQMTIEGYQIIYTSDTECYHFPAVNKEGGQHHSVRFFYELYKIINNNIFLDRHFDFIKNEYKLKGTKFSYKFKFAKMVLSTLLHGCIHKFILKGQ